MAGKVHGAKGLRPGPVSKVTMPMLQEMNRLYDSGLTMKEVGEVVGMSKSGVGRYIWNPRGRGKKLQWQE